MRVVVQGCEALFEAELVSYLKQNTSAFNLIVSADTLVYFGNLEPFFRAAKNALLLGGHVVFTLEKMDNGKNYRLNHHGRYSHSKGYGFLVTALFNLAN